MSYRSFCSEATEISVKSSAKAEESSSSLNFNYSLNFLLRLALEQMICKRSLKIKTSASFRLGNRAWMVDLWNKDLECVDNQPLPRLLSQNECILFQVRTIERCTNMRYFILVFLILSYDYTKV